MAGSSFSQSHFVEFATASGMGTNVMALASSYFSALTSSPHSRFASVSASDASASASFAVPVAVVVAAAATLSPPPQLPLSF